MNMRLLFCLFAAFIFVVTGCSKPLNKSAIVPARTNTYKTTGLSITVLPVTVRPQPKPGMTDTIQTMPDADLYRKVIMETLEGTGIFSEVKTDGDSNYLLNTEVIAARLIGSVNNIGLFLIRYKLVDKNSETFILNENIFSYSMLSAVDVFAGYERAAKVVETSLKNNLTQLVARIGEALSSQKKTGIGGNSKPETSTGVMNPGPRKSIYMRTSHSKN